LWDPFCWLPGTAAFAGAPDVELVERVEGLTYLEVRDAGGGHELLDALVCVPTFRAMSIGESKMDDHGDVTGGPALRIELLDQALAQRGHDLPGVS
jgi:hypothetical protein